MSRRTRALGFCLLCIFSIISFLFSQAVSDTHIEAKSSNTFIHTSGRKLLDGNNKEFIAKGIAFGNDVWSNPSLPVTTHHNESSYKELSLLGFNSIRFYLNYGLFEDDKAPLYLGEFGCITYAFQEGRGGERFVSDIIDICKEGSISFNYHAYHEESFGLYQNSAKLLPAKPNKLLMNVFRTKLK